MATDAAARPGGAATFCWHPCAACAKLGGTVALRLLEAFVPERVAEEAEALLREGQAHRVWRQPGGSGEVVVRAVVGAERTGAAIDALHERFHGLEGFRVLVLPLDATLPRPHASAAADERRPPDSSAGVSREEIYAKISEGAVLSADFLAMTALAAVVAAIGMVKSNTAAVIGAMVVAPLLGPNMALALGLTLADHRLTRAAVRTNVAGLAVAGATALAMGLLTRASPELPEIASRTRVDLFDLVLALAAGSAGALAYTSGAPTYLIGVMVAVAILPPTVASGMLLGSGHPGEALAAALLVLANVTAVNLMSMLVLRVKGMAPRVWWQAERARESARRGIVVWLGLLLVLSAAILLSRRYAG